jgi:hypothetical protein
LRTSASGKNRRIITLVCPSTADHDRDGGEGIPEHAQVVSDQDEQKNEAVRKLVALHSKPLIPEHLELSINHVTNTILEQCPLDT